MDTLFSEKESSEKHLADARPLAAKIRPDDLNGFIGQKTLVGEGGIIHRMIQTGELHSLILWGPPGCGKTTLAKLIARLTNTRLIEFSAVTSGVKEVKAIIAAAKEHLKMGMGRTILFIDELHRFNKAQQDAFLPHVEAGTIILIGATTENPYFSINAPLLSRIKIYRLDPLSDEELEKVIERAVVGMKEHEGITVTLEKNTKRFLIDTAGGDARFVINSIEIASGFKEPVDGAVEITLDDARKALMMRSLKYDKTGDEHYDTISAFIKSMRGSDPDATVYYLARMLEAGEDPKFIARRIVIQAAEDVGNANPMALVVANAAREAVEFVGMPEAALPLAQAAIYLAVSPKSNASYLAINAARKDVAEGQNPPIPLWLRNAPFTGAKEIYGFSEGYEYPHDYPLGYTGRSYLPDELKDRKYYKPKPWGEEKTIREWMEAIKKAAHEGYKKKGEKPEKEKGGSGVD